jgi:beta-D-xylosidase 4
MVDLAPLAQLLESTLLRTDTHFPRLAEVQPAGLYRVNVTNTGAVDASDVVLGFISPPGAGTNNLPLKSLFGFEKVFVKAGQSVTVDLYPQMTELAVTGLGGERSPLAGVYRVSFGLSETADHGQGYTTAELVAGFA